MRFYLLYIILFSFAFMFEQTISNYDNYLYQYNSEFENKDKMSESNKKKLIAFGLSGLFSGAGQFYLSYMTDRWIMKRLKKHPHITTYNELMEVYKNENISHGGF